MPNVNSSTVSQEIIKGADLQLGADGLQNFPMKLGEKIIPVFIANRPVPKLVVVHVSALDDSDKILTVPLGKTWEFLYGFINFAATATVGNRRMRIEIQDAAGVIIFSTGSATSIVANATINFGIVPGGQAANTDSGSNLVFPQKTILKEGYMIRIFDSAAIDVAADDMVFRMVFDEHDYVKVI